MEQEYNINNLVQKLISSIIDYKKENNISDNNEPIFLVVKAFSYLISSKHYIKSKVGYYDFYSVYIEELAVILETETEDDEYYALVYSLMDSFLEVAYYVTDNLLSLKIKDSRIKLVNNEYYLYLELSEDTVFEKLTDNVTIKRKKKNFIYNIKNEYYIFNTIMPIDINNFRIFIERVCFLFNNPLALSLEGEIRNHFKHVDNNTIADILIFTNRLNKMVIMNFNGWVSETSFKYYKDADG